MNDGVGLVKKKVVVVVVMGASFRHRRQGTVGVFLRPTDREHRPLSSASMCCCDWPNFSLVQVDYCLLVSQVISNGVSVDPTANELHHDC